MTDRLTTFAKYAVEGVDEAGLLAGASSSIVLTRAPTMAISNCTNHRCPNSDMGTCRHARHSFHAASKLSSRQTQGFVSPTISFLNFLAYRARLTSIFVCGICSSLLQGMVFFLFLNETASTILTFVGTHQQLLLSKPGSLASLSLRMHAEPALLRMIG